MMEVFRYIDSNPALAEELNQQIQKMAEKEASLSTTIHLFAEKCGLTYFTIPPVSPEEDFPLLVRAKAKDARRTSGS